jgi:hypothetical protein
VSSPNASIVVTPESAADADPDARLAHEARTRLASRTLDHKNRLVSIELIGRLKRGDFGWVGEDNTFGIVSVAELGFRDPRPGDSLRARVATHPWGDVVESVAPTTLRRAEGSPGGPARPITVEPRTWHDLLIPGDIVICRVAFRPHSRVDPRGFTNKARLAVVLNVESDGVLARACFGAGGYQSRHGDSVALKDRRGLFDKQTVVDLREREIGFDRIDRTVGRLMSDDLGRVRVAVTDADRERLLMRRRNERGHLERLDQLLSDGDARETRQVLRVARRAAMDPAMQEIEHDHAAAALVLRHAAGDEEVAQALVRDGLQLRAVERIFHLTRDIVGLPVGWVMSRDLVLRGLDHLETRSRLGIFVKRDASGDLCLVQAATEASMQNEVAMRPIEVSLPSTPMLELEHAEVDQSDDHVFVEGDTGEEVTARPAAVLCDQHWIYGQLNGRRLDFRAFRRSLCGTDDVQAHWVGAAATPGLAQVHDALRRAGFIVHDVTDRSDIVATMARLAEENPNRLVLVVSNAVDVAVDLDYSPAIVEYVDDLEPHFIARQHTDQSPAPEHVTSALSSPPRVQRMAGDPPAASSTPLEADD